MTPKQDARTVSVKDIMTKAVVSIDVAATITDAAKMMEDTKIGAIVVTENNTPVGIVTDRDFAIKVVAHAYDPTTPVKMIMSSPLYSIGPDESIRMIADFMYTRGIRKLPVIDNDKVIGIVTATDLVRQFAVCTGDDLRKMYCETIVKIYEHFSPYA
jgi:CBS domain-containing protein